MTDQKSFVLYPDEIIAPAHAGTLLEEVEKVAALHYQGFNPFAIAHELWRPLR